MENEFENVKDFVNGMGAELATDFGINSTMNGLNGGASNSTTNINQYTFGDININAQDIKDANTIQDFVNMIQRTKNLYPVGGVSYGI